MSVAAVGTVHVVYVRHAESVANARRRGDKRAPKVDCDAHLSRAAYKDLACVLAPQVDVVFASSLLRAQQTALALFADTESHPKLFVLPFAVEHRRDGEPNDRPHAGRARRVMSATDQRRLDWRYVDAAGAGAGKASDTEKFLTHLGRACTDRWRKVRSRVRVSSPDLTVAVVGHSNFFQTLLSLEERMWNLAQLCVPYTLWSDGSLEPHVSRFTYSRDGPQRRTPLLWHHGVPPLPPPLWSSDSSEESSDGLTDY